MRRALNPIVRVLVALFFTATVFAVTNEAGAATKHHSTTKTLVCYRLFGTSVESHRFTGSCQPGWTKKKPTVISPQTRECENTWTRFIDISDNQDHPINWLHVATQVSGAYIKVAQSNTYVNEFLASDEKGMNQVGIPWGTYYFAEPSQLNGTASAMFFVKHGGGKGQFPPALDMEIHTLNGAQSVTWINDFESTVLRLTGRTPIIYTGAYYEWSGAPSLSRWPLWIAAYSDNYTAVKNACGLRLPKIGAAWNGQGWQMWQYSSVTYLWGIANHVDTSVAMAKFFTQYTGAGIQPPVKGYTTWPTPLYGYESHGTKVLAIQRVLVAQHLYPKAAENGVFTTAMKTSLEAYQARINVKADGNWSVETQAASTFFLKHHYTLTTGNSMAKMYRTIRHVSLEA